MMWLVCQICESTTSCLEIFKGSRIRSSRVTSSSTGVACSLSSADRRLQWNGFIIASLRHTLESSQSYSWNSLDDVWLTNGLTQMWNWREDHSFVVYQVAVEIIGDPIVFGAGVTTLWNRLVSVVLSTSTVWSSGFLSFMLSRMSPQFGCNTHIGHVLVHLRGVFHIPKYGREDSSSSCFCACLFCFVLLHNLHFLSSDSLDISCSSSVSESFQEDFRLNFHRINKCFERSTRIFWIRKRWWVAKLHKVRLVWTTGLQPSEVSLEKETLG